MTLSELDINKAYSYADYLKWKFEERVELIRGKLFKMSPAPNRLHQTLVLDIAVSLRNFLSGQKCKVFVSPFDVRLPGKSKEDKDIVSVVQPDICVVCDESKLDYKGCLGAPDIVVEILSPGNNSVELKNKYELYEQSAVQEYWGGIATGRDVSRIHLTKWFLYSLKTHDSGRYRFYTCSSGIHT